MGARCGGGGVQLSKDAKVVYTRALNRRQKDRRVLCTLYGVSTPCVQKQKNSSRLPSTIVQNLTRLAHSPRSVITNDLPPILHAPLFLSVSRLPLVWLRRLQLQLQLHLRRSKLLPICKRRQRRMPTSILRTHYCACTHHPLRDAEASLCIQTSCMSASTTIHPTIKSPAYVHYLPSTNTDPLLQYRQFPKNSCFCRLPVAGYAVHRA